MAYQSSYTGAEIDTAVAKVLSDETTSTDICGLLYNIEESANESQTLTTYVGGGLYEIVATDGTPTTVTATEIGSATVSPFRFVKEVCIPVAMVSAAQGKITEDLTRYYSLTRRKVAEIAIANGTGIKCKYGDTFIDTCSPDGMPVFCDVHPIGTTEETQSNCYCKVREAEQDISAELIKRYLEQLTVILRNMKDGDSNVLGYEADTIVIPGNNYKLEAAVRNTVNSANGYDGWKIVVLSNWSTPFDSFILISSEANKALGGNMLFDTVPFAIETDEDVELGDVTLTASASFGVGFGAYEHMLYFCSAENGTTMPGMTELTSE